MPQGHPRTLYKSEMSCDKAENSLFAFPLRGLGFRGTLNRFFLLLTFLCFHGEPVLTLDL